MSTDAHIPDPDGFYATLLEAHRELSDQESAELDARLVLLLASELGDQERLHACIVAARASVLGKRAAP